MRRGYFEVHTRSLLLGVAGGWLIMGFWAAIKDMFGGGGATSIGTGQAQRAGDGSTNFAARDVNAPVVLGDQHVHEAPPAPARPDWWLRDGAPDVRASFIMPSDSYSLQGDVRFTNQVRAVAFRAFGAGAPGEWYEPSKTNVNAPGMGFHVQQATLDPTQTYPDVPDGEVRFEVRFWWQDEERHLLYGGPVKDIHDPAKRLPLIKRW